MEKISKVVRIEWVDPKDIDSIKTEGGFGCSLIHCCDKP